MRERLQGVDSEERPAALSPVLPGREIMNQTEIRCENCENADTGEFVPAKYALSLSESNSAANINFTCDDCMKSQLDLMLSLGVGSVDIQSMRAS